MANTTPTILAKDIATIIDEIVERKLSKYKVTYLDPRLSNLRITGDQIIQNSLSGIHIAPNSLSGFNIAPNSLSGTHIAQNSLTGDHLQDDSITSLKVRDFSANVAQIAVAEIQSAVIDTAQITNLDAEVATIANAQIEDAIIQTAQIQDLDVYSATVVQAEIGTARIGYGQIDSLVAGTALITEGVGGHLYINHLAVTEANMVSLTVGELMVKGADNKFYRLGVDGEGAVTTTEVQVAGDNIASATIPGGKLIENSITAREINVASLFADVATIRVIKSANIDVAELFGNSATFGKVTTNHLASDVGASLDITSNEGFTSRVGEIYDDVDALLGYRLEVISTSDILSEAIQSTTLSAHVWHGSQDVTDILTAQRFNWRRVSSDSVADNIWNAAHTGLKSTTLTVLNVQYSATYSCDLTDGNNVAIIATGSKIIIDLTDGKSLSVYIGANQSHMQIYDVNAKTYSPNWASTSLVITPVIYANQTAIALGNSALSITWKRKEGSGSETALTTGESVSGNILTVTQNKIAGVTSGLLTYIAYVTYTDPDTGLPITRAADITFTMVRTGENAKSAWISGEQVFKYAVSGGAATPTQITLTANLQNVTMEKWQYKTGNAAPNDWADYPTTGDNATITGTTLVVKPTHAIWLGESATLRIVTSDENISDTTSIYNVTDGATGGTGAAGQNASVAFLTNENITFAGNASGQIAAVTVTCNVVAYTGTTKVTPTVGTISGAPTGMTVTKGSATGNEIPISIVITANATLGAATPLQGTLTVPVTAPVNTTLQIAWSKVNTGATGAAGVNAVVFSLFAPNGMVFQNQTGSLTIQTAAYSGTTAITTGATYVWKKYTAGSWVTISGQTGSSLTVNGSDVTGMASYRCTMTYGGKTYQDVITLVDKTDNYQADIDSTAGDVFKNADGSTCLICRLWQNGAEVDPLKATTYSTTAPGSPTTGTFYYKIVTTTPVTALMRYSGAAWVDVTADATYKHTKTYNWYRRDKDGNPLDSGAVFATGKVIYIDDDDVDNKTVFVCEVEQMPIIARAHRTISDLNDGISITDVDVMYYLSTSATNLSGGSWSTTAPAWVDGKYMWSRVKTTYSAGDPTYSSAACITGAAGTTGGAGTGISSITEEFYLSTSKSTQTGGSWVTTPPTWSAGNYMWTRSKIVYTNPSSTVYTTPICDTGWEAANEIEVGGRNHLPNSAWHADTTGWGLGPNVSRDTTYYLNEAYCVKSAQSGWAVDKCYGARLLADERIPVSVGDVITVSVSARVNNASTFDSPIGIAVEIYDAESVLVGHADIPYMPVASDNGMWKRISATYTVTHPDAVSATPFFYPQRNGTVWFACPKLEMGNKATDWTPSPTDIQKLLDIHTTDIDQTKYNIDLNATAISALDGRITTAELKITPTAIVSTVKSSTEYAGLSSSVTQTADKVTLGFEKYNKLDDDVRAYQEFGANGIILGASDSHFKTHITNTELAFKEDEQTIASINGKKLSITQAEITERIAIGSVANGGFFDFETTPSGMALKWRSAPVAP